MSTSSARRIQRQRILARNKKEKEKEMGNGVKVQVIRVKLDDGRYIVNFQTEVAPGVDVTTLPEVCLSRIKPGKCMFRIDKMEEHDGHSPTHSTLEECNAYIARVMGDVEEGLKVSGILTETETKEVKGIVIPGFSIGQIPPGATLSDN